MILLHFNMEASEAELERMGLSESRASNTNTIISGDNSATTMDHLAKQVSTLVN